jgi:hypothetical protein
LPGDEHDGADDERRAERAERRCLEDADPLAEGAADGDLNRSGEARDEGENDRQGRRGHGGEDTALPWDARAKVGAPIQQ